MNKDELIQLKNKLTKIKEQKYILRRRGLTTPISIDNSGRICLENIDGFEFKYDQIIEKIQTDAAVNYIENILKNCVQTSVEEKIDFNHIIVSISAYGFFIEKNFLEDAMNKGALITTRDLDHLLALERNSALISKEERYSILDKLIHISATTDEEYDTKSDAILEEALDSLSKKTLDLFPEKGLDSLLKEAVLDDIVLIQVGMRPTNNIEITAEGEFSLLSGADEEKELIKLRDKTINKYGRDARGFFVRYSEFKSKLAALGYETHRNFADLIDAEKVKYNRDHIIIDFNESKKNKKW